MSANENQDPAAIRSQTQQNARSGANWFYWISGLSLVNSVIFFFGGEWNFIFGLGITTLIDIVAQSLAVDAETGATAYRLAGLVLSCGALSIYVLFGWLAGRGKQAAYVTGMVFYGLDGLIFLAAGDWLGVGSHLFALFGMARGLKALQDLQQMPAAVAAPPAATSATTPDPLPVAAETEPELEPETVP